MKIFAIISLNGKQYKITTGTQIPFNSKEHKNDIGRTIRLNKVLLVATEAHTIIGRPIIKDAKVLAKIIGDHLYISNILVG